MDANVLPQSQVWPAGAARGPPWAPGAFTGEALAPPSAHVTPGMVPEAKAQGLGPRFQNENTGFTWASHTMEQRRGWGLLGQAGEGVVQTHSMNIGQSQEAPWSNPRPRKMKRKRKKTGTSLVVFF